jgi:hypothetical protein
MGFTDIIGRPDAIANPLQLGEAPSGTPVPIQAWFPTGSRSGLEFRHR